MANILTLCRQPPEEPDNIALYKKNLVIYIENKTIRA